jgi:hypothetical protein
MGWLPGIGRKSRQSGNFLISRPAGNNIQLMKVSGIAYVPSLEKSRDLSAQSCRKFWSNLFLGRWLKEIAFQ